MTESTLLQLLVCCLCISAYGKTPSTPSQTLQLVIANAKLPTRAAYHAALYDEVLDPDTIYLVGGDSNEVLKYSISADSIELLGRFDNYGGPAMLIDSNNSSRSIVHVGGFNITANTYQSEIWRLDTANVDRDREVIGVVPYDCTGNSPGVWDGQEFLYIVGGFCNRNGWRASDVIHRYSPATGVIEEVGLLPTARSQVAAVFHPNSGTVLVYGGSDWPRYYRDVLKFDPVTGQVTRLPALLPRASFRACAVLVGDAVYIIGGQSDEYMWPDVVTKHDLLTHQVTTYEVPGFIYGHYAMGCTYLAASRRIYLFGGEVSSEDNLDRIMYLQL